MSDASFVAARPASSAAAGSLSAIRYVRQTGFYPLYDGDNDQVDPVGPVARARFQRVIPRYQLSASETSDTGEGPSFYEIPVYDASRVSRAERRAAEVPALPDAAAGPLNAAARSQRPAPLPDWMGKQIDFYA